MRLDLLLARPMQLVPSQCVCVLMPFRVLGACASFQTMHFWRAQNQQIEAVFKEVEMEVAGQMGMVVAPDRFFHYVQLVLEGGLAQDKGVERDAVLLAVNDVPISPLTQAEMEAAIHSARYPKRMLFSKVGRHACCLLPLAPPLTHTMPVARLLIVDTGPWAVVSRTGQSKASQHHLGDGWR